MCKCSSADLFADWISTGLISYSFPRLNSRPLCKSTNCHNILQYKISVIMNVTNGDIYLVARHKSSEHFVSPYEGFRLFFPMPCMQILQLLRGSNSHPVTEVNNLSRNTFNHCHREISFFAAVKIHCF